MNKHFYCRACFQIFDDRNNLPIVLECGDSICMSCIASKSGQSFRCSICNLKYSISLGQLQDLPINNALLQIIKLSLPAPVKISNFDANELDEISPYLADEMKCKRFLCANDKLERNGTIYQYCSDACFKADSSYN